MISANCGTENLTGARFWMEARGRLSCATRAVARPTCRPRSSAPSARFRWAGALAVAGGAEPVAERRLVSVLLADLVGFTAYSEGCVSEEVRDLQSRYFETVRGSIARFGGLVEKFIGDAVMALWGAADRHDLVPKNTEARIDLALMPHVPGVLTDAKTLYSTVVRDLTDASDGWKVLVVLRNNRNDDAGMDRSKEEVEVVGRLGRAARRMAARRQTTEDASRP